MEIKKLSNEIDVKKYLVDLGVDSGGIKILSSKAKTEIFYIKDLAVGGANILKQDALSIGADLAVPRGTVIAKTPHVDCILIATTKQIETLAKKELAQPFGLKELALQLQNYLKTRQAHDVEIMGIVNANDDSFFSGSRFFGEAAVKRIEKLIEDGADIIDIGGVSSRPNAPEVSPEEELQRVQPILDAIGKNKLYEKAKFSIDSYTPSVVQYSLDNGFKIVNDITGFENDVLCKLSAEYDASAVVMHMQGTPQTMQANPQYSDVILDVYKYLEKQTQKLEDFGVKDIILDVGIGFGKSLDDNLQLLKHLEHFSLLGKELLIGASRKSMIDKITPSAIEDRIAGTLVLHLEAIRNGASIIRAHDVYEHKQALEVFKKIQKV
ncbi:dihydropteroate synthase [Sulfurimonas marina]|uniref:dihydropteroate synthase n=1 Tax=Sulfurimonas marina TaxID=2590551 RepID=A0A7M1AT76_9BACT|nr:dihydropteroate synthase [Sulfurimonas marina]QOP40621.1 dihydropteroate synthase [Sulfurimonas marina]